MTRILDRYILREYIPPFCGGLALFSFILLMDKILKLTDLLVVKGVGPGAIGRLLLYLLPPLFSFTIPMATLFASLVTFGRFSSDNEIVALRSCGLHPFRVMVPILTFGLCAVAVCLLLEIALIPSVNSSLRDIVRSIHLQKAFLSFDEKGFQDLGEDTVIYVHNIRENSSAVKKGYDGVLISSYTAQGPSRVIIARRGEIMAGKSGDMLLLSLMDGSIHRMELEDENTYQMMRFGRYDTALPLPGFSPGSGGKKKYKELTWGEIRRAFLSRNLDFQEETGLRIEWHRRFAFPFACLIFAFIGSLIGMESKWSGKYAGFAVCILLIIAYYFLLTAGSRLSVAGYLPPGISAWLPNGIFLGGGICLMRCGI